MTSRETSAGLTAPHPLTLKFRDAELESRFLADHSRRTRTQARLAILSAIVLYVVFSVIDPWVVGENYRSAWAVRVFVCVFLVGALGLTYSKLYLRAIRLIQWMILIVCCSGIIALIYLSDTAGQTMYYAGIMLIIIGCFVVFPFTFIHALLGTVLSVLAYLMVAILFGDLPTPIFYNNMIFLISTSLILGFAGYTRESYDRRYFVQQRELLHSREDLREARDDALAASQAKSEFLATMSHELRTPLNGILGTAQLAIGRRDLRASIQEDFEVIERSGELLLKLIDDILDITRIEAGRLEIERESFALIEVVEDVVEILRPIAAAQGTSISYDIAGDVPGFLVGDEARVRQILLNLSGNAVKFTQDGAVTIEVARTEGPGSAPLVRFSVVDTGIGIPAEDLGKIFDPLTQGTNAARRRFGGAGLGLSIVRRLVEAMNGTLSAASVVGEGSRFSFEIDLVAGAETDDAQSERSPTARITTPLRVLLVEDDPVSRGVAQAMLERFGHTVTTVDCGADAVSLVQDVTFDAILLDMRLPDMDGIDVVRTLRQEKNRCSDRVAIIAVTANVFPADIDDYLAAGCADVVAKPIQAERLLAVLGQAAPMRARGHANWFDKLEIPGAFNAELFRDVAEKIGTAEMLNLVGQLQNSIRQTVAEIEATREDGSYSRAVDPAHRLAGAASCLGLAQLTACLNRLEADIRSGKDAAEIAQTICDLQRLGEEAMTALAEVQAGIAAINAPDHAGPD